MGVWVWVSIRDEIWRRLPRTRKLPWGFMCFFNRTAAVPAALVYERCGVCHSLSLFLSLSLSHSLSGSYIEKHDYRGLQWYLGLLSTFNHLWFVWPWQHYICTSLCFPLTVLHLPYMRTHSLCVCIKLWGSSWVLLAQNRTSGLIIHAANTLIRPWRVH